MLIAFSKFADRKTKAVIEQVDDRCDDFATTLKSTRHRQADGLDLLALVNFPSDDGLSDAGR